MTIQNKYLMLVYLSMSKVTLIDYWAEWCGPCKIMNPIIDELEKEFVGKVEVQRVNVDEETEKASAAGVMSIPTYVILKDDKEIARKIGVTSKSELAKLLQA